MEALWSQGARVQAYDPVAMDALRATYDAQEGLSLCEDPMQALEDADALVIVTEWSNFRAPDFKAMRALLKQPVIFDGRNMLDHNALYEMGFEVYSIGKGYKTHLK